MKSDQLIPNILLKTTVKMFYKLIYFYLFMSLIALAVSLSENKCENGCANNSTIIHRSKRYLDFIPLSRMFFRANIKDNIIQVNQFWAQAYGFRANYPIENHKRAKRSDVYDTLSDLINQHGFDGRACILKTFCDASKALTPNSGMLFKMFKLIFSDRRTDFTSGFNSLPKDDEKLYPYLKSNDCEELNSHCPLSLLNLTPYTDV